MPSHSQQPSWQQLLSPTLVVLLVCLLYVSGVLIQNSGDPTAFALLGTRFSQGDPQGSEGYDGQFAYQIAVNPTAAADFIDVPAYRYQRILYPLLAHLLALGNPMLVPWTLILINIAAIVLGTRVTELLLQHWGANRWYALVYGLYGGQMLALRADLVEPLAQALVVGAILAWARQQRWLAVLAFGLAALTKETTLIFLAAYILFCLVERKWKWVLGLGLAAVPFVFYQLGLYAWLGSFGVGSGGAGATAFSLVPLGGWLAIAGISPEGFLLIGLIVLPMSILPALAGIFLSGRDLVRRSIHPIVFCLLLNSLMILFLPNSTFREPAAMVRLTQGLMVSMLLYGALRQSKRILMYSQLWIATNVLVVKGVSR